MMVKKLICCDVFKEEVQVIGLPEDMEVEFISMGLHLHPAKLHQELKEALLRAEGYSLVILGFGLCGGSLKGLEAPDCPMVMPRVHDCIPVLLGSTDRYNVMQAENNRTFYFSGGWAEGDRMMIPEYQRTCSRVGENRAKKVFKTMFENYNRLMYIHTGHPRGSLTLQQTRDFAQTLQLPCHETEGSVEYLRRLIFGPWDEDLFVTIPARGSIQEGEFLSGGCQMNSQMLISG